MSSMPPIAVRPDRSLTPDQAHDARARAWAYVFACYAEKKAGAGKEKAGAPIAGDDPKGGFENDSRAKSIIP